MLERGGGALNWTIVRIPFDSAKLWGTRGQIRVKGEINGFPFKTSLFPSGDGQHLMLVNKTMQKGGRVTRGDEAKFRLEPDTDERTVVVPQQLEAIFAEDRALRRWFSKMSRSNQYWICKWVTDVKSEEARARRADQIAERMLATMEAEVELPPVLKIAFANDPIAHAGWKRMSTTHRRGHLLGIFYYRDPKARSNRIAKMLEDARKYASTSGRSRTARPSPDPEIAE